MPKIVDGRIVTDDEEAGNPSAAAAPRGGHPLGGGGDAAGGAEQGLLSGSMQLFGRNVPLVAVAPVGAVLVLVTMGLKGVLMMGALALLAWGCRKDGRSSAATSGASSSGPGDRPGPRFRTVGDLPQTPRSGG